MARPLRIEKVGGWYHVTARGNERKAIFRDDADRRHFLEIVAEMVPRFRLRLHCFVLMDNHYHLILELREEQVRERMRKLQAYRWSSYRWYIGLGAAPTWLECDTVLALGGGAKTEPRRRYREYVETAAREGLEQSPWEAIQEQVVLGGAEFLAGLRKQIRGDAQEQMRARRLTEVRPDLEAVIAAVEWVKGEKWVEFRDRHGDRGRDLVLYLGRRLCGLKLKELAAAVGLPNYKWRRTPNAMNSGCKATAPSNLK